MHSERHSCQWVVLHTEQDFGTAWQLSHLQCQPKHVDLAGCKLYNKLLIPSAVCMQWCCECSSLGGP
jgi:hypothetical protein